MNAIDSGLTATGLTVSRGNRTLFTDLSFTLAAGGVLLLRGANGSGKTSLLRTLAGLGSADAGEVRCDGKTLRPFSAPWRAQLVYAGHADGIKAELSAAENLADLLAFDASDVDAAARQEALQKVQLDSCRNLPARRLSQGQKRRIGLARLALSKKRLWLLDEPSNALDREGVALFTAIVQDHLAGGGMACIATHLALEFAVPAAELRLGAA